MSKPTDTNQASEDELERKLMDLFARVAEFGRVFLTSATKEEFAESIRAGALDHQEAAHEAMKLIRTEKLKLLAEVRERVIGEDLPPDVATDSGIGYSRQQFAINMGKAGQRTKLTKLEAEL